MAIFLKERKKVITKVGTAITLKAREKEKREVGTVIPPNIITEKERVKKEGSDG